MARPRITHRDGARELSARAPSAVATRTEPARRADRVAGLHNGGA